MATRNRAILDLPMTARSHDPVNTRTLDVSGRGNHSAYTIVTKIVGQHGYNFPVGNAAIQTPVVYDLDDSNWSFEFMVNINNIVSNSYGLLHGDIGPNDYWLVLHRVDRGGLTLQYNGNSGGAAARFTTPSRNMHAGCWQHVVICRGAGLNFKIYQDSFKITDQVLDFSGGWLFSPQALGIGGNTPPHGNSWLGQIGLARFYQFELTQIQVNDLQVAAMSTINKV